MRNGVESNIESNHTTWHQDLKWNSPYKNLSQKLWSLPNPIYILKREVNLIFINFYITLSDKNKT